MIPDGFIAVSGKILYNYPSGIFPSPGVAVLSILPHLADNPKEVKL